MRINKYLASAGIASRRQVERLILNGEIKVNGEMVRELSTNVNENDQVEYNGKIVKLKKKQYFAVNKPVGYVSTTGDKHAQKIVTELVPAKDRLFIVGRLDVESEGLVILTNDGEYAQIMSHPRHEHEKEYEVVIGFKDDESFQKSVAYLKAGITLEGYKTKPAKVEIMDKKDNTSRLRVILKEGRNRQIRKTVQKAGAKVYKLYRTRIGDISLGSLKPSEYREFKI